MSARPIVLWLPVAAALWALLLGCSKNTGTGNEPVGLSATIYETNGKDPASGVLVKIFRGDDDEPVSLRFTDRNGVFSVKDLPEGLYSIFAEKDSFVLFQDSVRVAPNRGGLRSDTLESPSSLTGIVGVEPVHDPSAVTIRILGTGKTFEVPGSDGRFRLQGLASGRYRLILESSRPEYLPTNATVSVLPRSHAAVEDTLRMAFSGIPVVSGIRISQDVFSGTIRICWNRTRCGDFKDYVIYNDPCGAIDLLPEPSHSSIDTFMTDSTFAGLYANPADTVPRCLNYRVAVRTVAKRIGLTNGYTEFQFLPKTYIWTYFSHDVRCEGRRFDSISIGDTFTYRVRAWNRTRPLRRLNYFAPNIWGAAVPLTDTTKKEISDSVRFAFGDVGSHRLFCSVFDSTGHEWADFITVKTVIDTLAVDAGNDTGVFTGEPVRLHGSVYHLFGTIPVWRWWIGSADSFGTSGPDTLILAPPTEGTIKCFLRVTDEDGTSRRDSMNIATSLKVQGVAAGSYYSLFLKSDGALWACGRGEVGQLCDGYQENRHLPVRVMTGVQSMAAGAVHTLVLGTDKSLWACGDNSAGQFGDGTSEGRLIPKRIMNDVQNIAANGFVSLILKTDASVWMCGQNPPTFDETTDSLTGDPRVPQLLMKEVRSMAAGRDHLLILKTDGSVWAWGGNLFGQLGDSTQERRSRAAPVKVMSGVLCVAAGDYHSVMVTSDGALWGCGNNSFGQLGGAEPILLKPARIMDGVQSVTAGPYSTMIIKKDGTLWACGKNENGLLGLGRIPSERAPAQVTSDVRSVAAGADHTLILKNDGTVWSCGSGAYGQLGCGAYVTGNRDKPVRTIPYHYYAQ
jgi:alpha-tubulin suppressor-like RCC1 family protein